MLATGLVAILTAALALTVSLDWLAEAASLATLVVFALVNLALLRLHSDETSPPGLRVRVPRWIPAAGLASCVAMIASPLLK